MQKKQKPQSFNVFPVFEIARLADCCGSDAITDEEEGGKGGEKYTIFMKHCQVNAMQHLLAESCLI